jgi:hypothetical protein
MEGVLIANTESASEQKRQSIKRFVNCTRSCCRKRTSQEQLHRYWRCTRGALILTQQHRKQQSWSSRESDHLPSNSSTGIEMSRPTRPITTPRCDSTSRSNCGSSYLHVDRIHRHVEECNRTCWNASGRAECQTPCHTAAEAAPFIANVLSVHQTLLLAPRRSMFCETPQKGSSDEQHRCNLTSMPQRYNLTSMPQRCTLTSPPPTRRRSHESVCHVPDATSALVDQCGLEALLCTAVSMEPDLKVCIEHQTWRRHMPTQATTQINFSEHLAQSIK